MKQEVKPNVYNKKDISAEGKGPFSQRFIFFVYKKTTSRFQIKFIGDNYLQMCKILQLFNSLITLNTNIFKNIEVIKKHWHIFSRTQSY
jgi:hypothetical protein